MRTQTLSIRIEPLTRQLFVRAVPAPESNYREQFLRKSKDYISFETPKSRWSSGPPVALRQNEDWMLSEVAREDLENACSEGGPARDDGRAAPPISCLWSTRS